MTTDCSLNYKFNTWKVQAQTRGEQVVYRNCFWHSEQFLYTTCSELVFFWVWSCKSMNNLLSYFGLTDARMNPSEKDLPVAKLAYSAKYNKVVDAKKKTIRWQKDD